MVRMVLNELDLARFTKQPLQLHVVDWLSCRSSVQADLDRTLSIHTTVDLESQKRASGRTRKRRGGGGTDLIFLGIAGLVHVHVSRQRVVNVDLRQTSKGVEHLKISFRSS